MCVCVGMLVASRRAIEEGGLRPRGWGIKENHLHLSDSSNLKFLQDSSGTDAILLKWRATREGHPYKHYCFELLVCDERILALTRFLTKHHSSLESSTRRDNQGNVVASFCSRPSELGAPAKFCMLMKMNPGSEYQQPGAFHQNVIGRSQDKFARLPTSRVLRATPPKIQHPGDTFRLQKLYPLQICFFALSAPRANLIPYSKIFLPSIVLVQERTFYWRLYNV